MNENNSVIMDGYRFTYISRTISSGTTTLVYEVKGTGESDTALESWVLQLCPQSDLLANADIIKCIVQQGDEAPFEAVCEKVINNEITGIRFRESVGAAEEDPAVKFIIMMSGEVDDDCVMLRLENGSIVYHSDETDETVTPAQEPVVNDPLTLPFSVLVNIPEGFSIDSDVDIEAVITSRKLRAVYEQSSHPALVLPPYNMMTTHAIVVTVYAVGVVNILVKVPIVDAEGDFKASVCARAYVGIDSQVCSMAEKQDINLDVMVSPEISAECQQSKGNDDQMCVVSGDIVVRCIDIDV